VADIWRKLGEGAWMLLGRAGSRPLA
jgi:hypothetical protein